MKLMLAVCIYKAYCSSLREGGRPQITPFALYSSARAAHRIQNLMCKARVPICPGACLPKSTSSRPHHIRPSDDPAAQLLKQYFVYLLGSAVDTASLSWVFVAIAFQPCLSDSGQRCTTLLISLWPHVLG